MIAIPGGFDRWTGEQNLRRPCAVLPPKRQVCFNGLGNEDFGLVVGIAERSGFAALVEDLPVGFLGVAKPYVGTGFE